MILAKKSSEGVSHEFFGLSDAVGRAGDALGFAADGLKGHGRSPAVREAEIKWFWQKPDRYERLKFRAPPNGQASAFIETL